jgi:hypothetical protein
LRRGITVPSGEMNPRDFNLSNATSRGDLPPRLGLGRVLMGILLINGADGLAAVMPSAIIVYLA